MTRSLENCLTPNEIKRYVFARDKDFLTTWEMMQQGWTSSNLLHDLLWNSAALILRPDAIAGGQSVKVLPLLRDLGFVPIVVRPVSLSHRQTRALWRYQANVSTVERLRLLDLIMTSGTSLYILFRDETARVSAPATVHLTYLKGTAIVNNRRRWHLRTVAGPLVANIVSYVHVADDPADLLREMAVLLPPPERLEMMKEAAEAVDKTDEVRSLILSLQSRLPANVLGGTCHGRRVADADDMAKILNIENLSLTEAETRHRWRYIVQQSRSCKVFKDGDSYDGHAATVPDDKELSLPLDAHLIFRELGPR